MGYMESRDAVIAFAYRDLLGAGVPDELAQFAAYAMFPPTAHARATDKTYYKELKRAANGLAKTTKKLRKRRADHGEYEQAAIEALNTYIEIAQRCGDHEIVSWSNMILNTHDLAGIEDPTIHE